MTQKGRKVRRIHIGKRKELLISTPGLIDWMSQKKKTNLNGLNMES
jgi:hypothetical protein